MSFFLVSNDKGSKDIKWDIKHLVSYFVEQTKREIKADETYETIKENVLTLLKPENWKVLKTFMWKLHTLRAKLDVCIEVLRIESSKWCSNSVRKFTKSCHVFGLMNLSNAMLSRNITWKSSVSNWDVDTNCVTHILYVYPWENLSIKIFWTFIKALLHIDKGLKSEGAQINWSFNIYHWEMKTNGKVWESIKSTWHFTSIVAVITETKEEKNV